MVPTFFDIDQDEWVHLSFPDFFQHVFKAPLVLVAGAVEVRAVRVLAFPLLVVAPFQQELRGMRNGFDSTADRVISLRIDET